MDFFRQLANIIWMKTSLKIVVYARTSCCKWPSYQLWTDQLRLELDPPNKIVYSNQVFQVFKY